MNDTDTSTRPPNVIQEWRKRIYIIVFGTDTALGRAFDILLLGAILLSVLAVMMESVQAFALSHGLLLRRVEWFFTILFTIEYGVRLFSSPRPLRYVLSFFGVIDLISILPTYVSLYFDGAQSLLVIRAMRLLRTFRILKLSRFVGESHALIRALAASRAKIIVFFWAVLSLVLILGTLMYLIEGAEHGFTSIPRSIYWAIVTMTTVGYGDITPQTTLGQSLAACVMILGYAIIAVPTGIVSAELTSQHAQAISDRECPSCHAMVLLDNAHFCAFCGARLP